MDRRIFWLRASYWAGTILSFMASLQMIQSGLFGFSGKKDFAVFFFATGFFALGGSWLLIRGGRKPEQRKGFLGVVLCPVLIAWVAAEIFGFAFAGFSFSSRLPFWLIQGCLSFLVLLSSLRARRAYPKWWSQRA
ncbi:MAG: hypothetical protein HXY45_09150 [Syntrophaceae bacterium]|nr:hypothetical protein [Syntrophaceae bacterium]